MRAWFHCAIVAMAAIIAGCGDEKETAAPPVTPPVSTPPAAVSTPPAAPATAEVEEPPAELKARAEKLKALPWAELGKLKIGEEAIILIQGQTKNVGAVYGTGPYTADSFPPAAVVHAGILKDGEWGLIRFKIVKFDGDHGGSVQNGITARKWGKYHRSYTVERIADE